MKTDLNNGTGKDEVTADQKGLIAAPAGWPNRDETLFGDDDEIFWDMFNNGALAGDPTAYGDS